MSELFRIEQRDPGIERGVDQPRRIVGGAAILGSLLGQEQPTANAPAAADDPVTAHFAELNSIVSKNEGEPAAIDGLLSDMNALYVQVSSEKR